MVIHARKRAGKVKKTYFVILNASLFTMLLKLSN